MKSIPETQDTVVLRTDFSDDAAWKEICAAIRQGAAEDQAAFAEWAEINASMGQNVGEPRAWVNTVDDPDYADITTDQLLELVPEGYGQTFLFVVDGVTVSHTDQPILVVDLYTKRGRSFRAIPSQIQGIENNLSIANMDWEDFGNNVDDDGVFRGFPK